MGHVERERCLFFKGIRVGNPKQKMHVEKFVVKKPPSSPFPRTCFVPSHTRESVGETRDERRREGYTHADTHARTHTHTHRERVFKKRVRERERARERLTLFSFFCVTDELIQKREREEL